MKTTKAIIALILALCAAISFAACSKGGETSTSSADKSASSAADTASVATSADTSGESESSSETDATGLVGEWVFTYEMSEIMAATFAATLPDLVLSENSLPLKAEYTFAEDGTYSTAIDTASLSESLEAYKKILAADLKKYFDDKGDDRSDEAINELLLPLSAEAVASHGSEVNGKYTVTEVDGKSTLTLVPADEFGDTESEEYEIVSCDAKKLVLKQGVGENSVELEFTRK